MRDLQTSCIPLGSLTAGTLADAASLNGPATKRRDADDLALMIDLGTMNGTLDLKLQTSADGSTGWTDASPAATLSIATSAANSAVVRSFSLKNAPQLTDGYVRLVATANGGTVGVSGAVVALAGVGDTEELPADNLASGSRYVGQTT